MVFNIWYLSIIKTIITHTIEFITKNIYLIQSTMHIYLSLISQLILWHDLLFLNS